MFRRGNHRILTIVLAGVLAVAVLPAPTAYAQETPGDACPEPVPADEMTEGLTGTGFTVERGTAPEPFDVEVIGVLENGIAPDVDLILVEASSAAIDEFGIWFGMSGSPVYVDGELLGAVAYGLADTQSAVAGLTPGHAMTELFDYDVGVMAASQAALEVELPDELQQRIADTTEASLAEATEGLRRLELPVGMSGLRDDRLEVVGGTFERVEGTGPLFRTSTVPGDETADPDDVEPGGNFAAALSYGDVTAAGLGTTTLVCDDEAIAFGHPALFDGATRQGANLADALLVHDNDPFAGHKEANLLGRVGMVTQDRLAGVAAALGADPDLVPVTSDTRYVDEDRNREGRTDVVHPDFLADLTASHLLANLDRVFDQIGEGSSALSWTISGSRAFGDDWVLERSNQFASQVDITLESVTEIAQQLAMLQDNEFEPVEFSDVDVDVEVTDEFRQLLIEEVRVDGEPADFVELSPGQTLVLEVELRRWQTQDFQTVELALEVPEGVAGAGIIEIGQDPAPMDVFPTDPVVGPEPAPEDPPFEADSFEELLAALEDAPRNNELIARLLLFPEPPEDEPLPPVDEFEEPVAQDSVELDDVVEGFETIEAILDEGVDELACPIDDVGPPLFEDVTEDHTHALAIACLSGMEITSGISEDPPRYGPRREVTRGQMAAFLARSLEAGGFELPRPEDQGLTDVPGTTHADTINQLVAAGILAGRGDGTFAPSQSVRRDQTATMLVQALEWALDAELGPEDGPHFPDVEGAHAENVDTAFELGLVRGRTDGTFAPTAPIQRGQMATVLVGTLNLLLAEG